MISNGKEGSVNKPSEDRKLGEITASDFWGLSNQAWGSASIQLSGKILLVIISALNQVFVSLENLFANCTGRKTHRKKKNLYVNNKKGAMQCEMLFIDVNTRVLEKYTIPVVNLIMLMSSSTRVIHSLT